MGPVNVSVGDVEVTIDVVGFKKYRQFSEEMIGDEPLDLPTIRFNTVALWFDIPAQAIARIAEKGQDFAGGLGEYLNVKALSNFTSLTRPSVF